MNRQPLPPGDRYGADGILTLLLSTLVVAATCGLSLVWASGRVIRVARATPTDAAGEYAIVLGLRLDQDQVTPGFALRLERARQLYEQGRCRRLLLLGGLTGNATTTEARRGREFLLARGVPAEAILTEDGSRHTLENLQHARAMLGTPCPDLVLITSRYHLARSSALAEGLRLPHRPCAAEERLTLSPGQAGRLLAEGFFLHWYHVGRAWSLATRNRKSLARIT